MPRCEHFMTNYYGEMKVHLTRMVLKKKSRPRMKNLRPVLNSSRQELSESDEFFDTRWSEYFWHFTFSKVSDLNKIFFPKSKNSSDLDCSLYGDFRGLFGVS